MEGRWTSDEQGGIMNRDHDMSDERHQMTGTLTYAVIKCGRCPKTWEQLALVGDKTGDWFVCPHCGFPAATDMKGGPV